MRLKPPANSGNAAGSGVADASGPGSAFGESESSKDMVMGSSEVNSSRENTSPSGSGTLNAPEVSVGVGTSIEVSVVESNAVSVKVTPLGTGEDTKYQEPVLGTV